MIIRKAKCPHCDAEPFIANALYVSCNKCGESFYSIENEIELPIYEGNKSIVINDYGSGHIKKGIKYDDGKPKLCDILKGFYPGLVALSELYNFGALKHGLENWKLVERKRYMEALARHFTLLNNGDIINTEKYKDKEYKFHHSIQIAWNALVIYWLDTQKG